MTDKFEPITTQEEFDERIKQRLGREKETHAKETKTLQDAIKELTGERDSYKTKLEEQEENYKTKLEEQANKLSGLQSEADGYKLANLKTKVALDSGLPYQMAERLKGDDVESLTKDAEAMAEIININRPTDPLKNTESNSECSPLADMLNDLKSN